MPMPWEKDFWGGKKGGVDFWDIATLGGSEIASQTFGGNNPLQSVGNIYNDLSGKTAADAAKEAARRQEDLGYQALDLQREMFETGRQDMMPWLQAGKEGLGELQGAMKGGQFDQKPFSFTMQDYEASPYYNWLQEQGNKSMQRSAAARGGLLSGGTLSGLQRQGQMLGMQDFQNQFGRAYNTYGANQSNLQNKYNRMASMANVGQTAAGNMGTMGANFGAQGGNILQNIGNVQAGGIMGAQNARQNAFLSPQNLLNLGTQAAAMYFSDRRLKTDIKPIGKWKGFTKYLFKYIGNNQPYIGLMADEVKEKRPDAVQEKNGYLMVNYGVL